MSFADKKIY